VDVEEKREEQSVPKNNSNKEDKDNNVFNE